MKKVININFQGQVIAIEETAYEILKHYIDSLKNYFSREEGGDEIVNDIESRIAELFGNRLKHGIHCITDEDVEAIISSIGKPEDFDSDYERASASAEDNVHQFTSKQDEQYSQSAGTQETRSLYRNRNDKIIAGVCSGLANYFRTDPVWIRIIFVLLFSFLFWVYIVLWIVLRPKALEANVTKRLYRNPNDRFFGGVCGGIAAYFKVDSWIPRLIFLVPLLLNMIGMLSFFPLNRLFDHVDFNWNLNTGVVMVYIVLWIIIPEAKTVKQKLEMMGEDDYIRSIRETVSDNVTSARNKTEAGGSIEGNDPSYAAADAPASGSVRPDVMPPEPPKPPRNVRRSASTPTPSSERSGCLNVLALFFKIIFFAFVSIFALTLVGMFLGFLFAGTQLIPLKSLFIDSGAETHLLWVTAILTMGVPVLAIIVWIIRRVMKTNSRPVIGVVVMALWFGGIVTGIVLTTRIAEKFRTESSSERTLEIRPFQTDKLYIDMLPYADDYASIKTGFGPNMEFDELPYYTINEDSLLFPKINLHITESTDSLFRLKTIGVAKGKDLRTAKAYMAEFSYNIVQKDSLLLLPEFFAVPIRQGFRDQSLTVEVAVPAGKKIEISEALEEYKNNRLPEVVRKKYRRYTRTFSSDGTETSSGEKGEEYVQTDTI